MQPKLQRALFIGAALVLAVWMGFQLAEGALGLPLAVAALIVLLTLRRLTGVSPEGLALAGCAFCYIVGNRGFAQLSLLPGLPALPAESALALAVPLLVVRSAFARELPVRKDALNLALVAWLVVSAGRLVPDLPRWGLLAVRDFASVYYAVFFFLAQQCARREADRRVIGGAILAGMLVLIPTYVLSELFPEVIQLLQVGGVPLILYKPDLVSTMLAAGVLLFYGRERAGGTRLWTLASLGALALMSYIITRSVMLGLAATVAIFLVARDRRFVLHLAALGVAALTGLALEAALSPRDFTQSKLYSVYEHAASIADLGGARVYRNEEAANSGDNNRFRLIWWKSVVEQTATANPLLGLGFGADLSNDFVRSYYGPDYLDFNTRSPHNFLITLFGRTGAAGLVAFFAVLGALWLELARAIRRVRATSGDANRRALGLLGGHAAVWIVLIAAFFGVVLEGPMGAVPFWILLGLLHHDTRATEAEESAEPVQTAGGGTGRSP